jgi:hypothetical protein
VLDGLLSPEEAARHFAVILDPALESDAAATAKRDVTIANRRWRCRHTASASSR